MVRPIFELALSGFGAVRIAKALKAERIINPSAYKAKKGDMRFSRYNDNQNPDKMYEWCYATIQLIMQDRVYVGDMENHKAEVANYKTKQRVPIPQEQHIVVENTHEPIVSREDFQQVQTLIKSRPPLRWKISSGGFCTARNAVTICQWRTNEAEPLITAV